MSQRFVCLLVMCSVVVVICVIGEDVVGYWIDLV